MKRLILVLTWMLGCSAAGVAAEPKPLTTLHQIHQLTNEEASAKLPVSFEATVGYYRGYENNLFVQDGDEAVYVAAPSNAGLVPGDRVRIEGKTLNSFHPIVIPDQITFLRHEALPPAPVVGYGELIRVEDDCKRVTVRGVVHAADLAESVMAPVNAIYMDLVTDGGYFKATVDSGDGSVLEGLLDAEVELTGVASAAFDNKMQVTGALLHVQSLADVKIIKRAQSNPWSLPVTPMESVLGVYHVQDSTERVRVHGVITYYEPGATVVLQDGIRSIWISTQTTIPLRVGDIADATGFPDAHDGFLNLVHGEVRDTLTQSPVTPLQATWDMLTPSGYAGFGHHYDLVSIEGQVVSQVREASQDEIVLTVDGKLFSAFLHHTAGAALEARQIPQGARVRVTGICIRKNSNPFIPQVPFDILMRTFDDIQVVKSPSLWNVQTLSILVGLLLVAVALAGARGWILERKVRQETAALASRIEAEAALERRAALLEQRRSMILEHINGSRPLTEMLDEIVSMVAFTLENAHCWCEVADGARLGDVPLEMHGLRVVQVSIDARSGSALGSFCAAVDAAIPPSTVEIEALQTGARLATLAIETRRLYSDLRRRSEFDLLTDIPNRFSMEKFMDQKIEEAHKTGEILGLIYIDLDKFKPINDTYGHHIGDLYLHEVALRMSKQLLGGDMLARLGGDEFAALVMLPNGPPDLERIMGRLQHCFDEPFEIDGIVLHGAASLGVAFYPEDGTTRDELLSAADSLMYEVKKRRKQGQGSLAER